MNKGYEIAIIKDGQILKIQSQSEYNQQIIEQYKASNYANLTNENTVKPIYSERIKENNHQTKTVIEQQPVFVSQAVEAGVKPLVNLGYSIAFVFLLMITAVIAARFFLDSKDRKNALLIIQLFGIIAIGLIALNFFNSFN